MKITDGDFILLSIRGPKDTAEEMCKMVKRWCKERGLHNVMVEGLASPADAHNTGTLVDVNVFTVNDVFEDGVLKNDKR